MNTPTELYRIHRPSSFKGVVGQDAAVKTLIEMSKNARLPHAIIFTGPSGCGKTTLARIVQKKVGCGEADFTEINCADFRGIDMVRDIRSRMHLSPISGTSRVWLIDECHMMSKDAQNALLKMLEDTPGHVYFMLATTDPEKLLATIKTRCTEIKLKAMAPAPMRALIVSVSDKEGKACSEEVVDKIIEHAEGSARKALVLLNAIIGLENEDEQLAAVQANDCKAKAIELARALLNPGTGWPSIAALIKLIDEEPESIRRMVLAYMTNVMLGGGKMAPRAFEVADVFSNNFYDTGRPGLILACYALVAVKR